MKIATFNINNVNRRLPNLLTWLAEAKPNVVCLQELKCLDDDFPSEAIRKAGYHSLWRGQRTWNGVAILSRRKPVLTRTELPGDRNDTQSRYIEAARLRASLQDGTLRAIIVLQTRNGDLGTHGSEI
jgi:exodeoxyribonuclease III